MCLSLSRERVIALDRAPCAMPFHDVRTRFFQRGPQDDDPEGALEILDGSSPHVYMPGGSGVGPVSSLVTVLDTVMSDAADDGQHPRSELGCHHLSAPAPP